MCQRTGQKGAKRMEPDLSQRAQTEIQEIPTKHTETFLMVRVVKHWNRLPRAVGEPLPLQMFKT